MKYFIELLNSLKRGVIYPVYLFYGEEDYLIRQAVLRFQEALFPDGDAGMDLDVIAGESAAPREVTARAQSLPFFAQKRLVVVKNTLFFKPARSPAKDDGGEAEEDQGEMAPAGSEAPLLEYLKSPPDTTCLIFTTGGPVDRRRRLFKSLAKAGRAVEFTRLEKGDLARWLAQRVNGYGKRFSPGAVETLLERAGTSLNTLAREVEKLVSYTGDRQAIDAADVRVLCPPPLEESVFNVVDAIGHRRAGVALSGIRDLLAAREPPVRLLAMVARQFRLLLLVRDLLDQGCPAGQVAGRLKLNPFVAQKMAGQSINYSVTRLIRALEELLELDEAFKSGRLEFYPGLEALLLRLCAET